MMMNENEWGAVNLSVDKGAGEGNSRPANDANTHDHCAITSVTKVTK